MKALRKLRPSTNLKYFTCRILPDDYNYIYAKGRGRSWNAALRDFIQLVRDLEGEGLAELRGYFTPAEWMFMADALKSTDGPFWSRNELQRQIMEIRHMEAKSSYYGVEPAKLCEKVAPLSPINVLALTQRIHDFWYFSDAVTMAEWARY